jgi:hypothetical protein
LEPIRSARRPATTGVFQLGPEGGGITYVGCGEVLI